MTVRESTEGLVELARQGDRAAFDRIADRFGSKLRAAVLQGMGKRLRGTVEPDDLLQEILLRAYRSLPTFEWTNEQAFLRWLNGIARHVLLTAGARAGRAEILELDHDPPADGTSPSRTLRREERFENLEKALEALSPDHREVIRQACIEGKKLKEIALHMERSPEAVMKLLSRALDKLRTSFPPTESLHLPNRALGEGRSEANGQR